MHCGRMAGKKKGGIPAAGGTCHVLGPHKPQGRRAGWGWRGAPQPGRAAGVNPSIPGRRELGETPARGGGTAKRLLPGRSGSRIPALAKLQLPCPGVLVPIPAAWCRRTGRGSGTRGVLRRSQQKPSAPARVLTARPGLINLDSLLMNLRTVWGMDQVPLRVRWII